MTIMLPSLCSAGYALDTSSQAFGLLRPSLDIADDAAALRARMEADGYLYLPGYLNREEVMAARHDLLSRLEEQGHLDPQYPLFEGVARQDSNFKFRPDLAQDNPLLHKVLYGGRMTAFYEMFLGAPIRHFDYTWLRAVAPGRGTAPHCDIVFMGRGTTQLYTAWTPLGDVDFQTGGLMILENSHRHERLKAGYGSKDVDAFCANKRPQSWDKMGGGGNIRAGGTLSHNPVKLRERLGGRWLSSEFQMGDLLTFSMFTVHASLDNQSNRIRLSSDSRYQLASELADERWIGPNPIGHGPNAKRAMIC